MTSHKIINNYSPRELHERAIISFFVTLFVAGLMGALPAGLWLFPAFLFSGIVTIYCIDAYQMRAPK